MKRKAMGGLTGRASGGNKATIGVWLGDWSCGKSWFSQQLILRPLAVHQINVLNALVYFTTLLLERKVFR